MARELSMWAESVFGMTASHPAGVDTFGESRKDMWPSPEGTAPPIPAFEQINPGDEEIYTDSSVLLPDPPVDIRHEVEVRSVIGPDSEVTCNSRNVVTIPWPTRDNHPLSENTTNHFFTMAFPTLFPYAAGDFRMNRPRTCNSMSD